MNAPLVTFRSDADADILMYRKHAEPILRLLGKDVARGIFTPEQLPEAIAKLEAAIEEDRARQRALREVQDKDEEENGDHKESAAGIGLAQRAWPLLEMMKRAAAEGKPVMWGL